MSNAIKEIEKICCENGYWYKIEENVRPEDGKKVVDSKRIVITVLGNEKKKFLT